MDSFEKSGKVGDLDAVQATLEESPQRKYASSLLADGYDDFAYPHPFDQVFNRSDLGQYPIGRDHRFLHLFQRIEPDNLQSGSISRIERRLDHARFRTRSQYQHAMGKQRLDKGTDNGVTHNDEAAEGEHKRRSECVLEDLATRQHVGKQISRRDSE